MKSGIKKRSIITIIIGLLFAIISGILVFNNCRIIAEGQKVPSIVTRVIEVTNDDGTNYRPEFTYTYQGVEKIYQPSYSASRSLVPNLGDEKVLYISDRGISTGIFNISFIAPLIAFIIGLFVLVFGINSIAKGIRGVEKTTLLKRHGRKIHARFIRQDSANMPVNNQRGVILFFQEEDGEQVFQTHPIYSNYSIKWLEEHLFDVYIDTANADNYYIDMEKHFGEPVRYN
ncbi:MAG: hypothetical protein ACI870_000550 [Crocinitomicaceae bacterium]|jgi:hypothetical protein